MEKGPRFRKRYCHLTISKKLEIIYAVDSKDRSKTEVAKEYGIPMSTLSTFLKNRDSIEKAAAEGKDKRKRIRLPKHQFLEKELYIWYKRVKNNNNMPMSIGLLKEKAQDIAYRRGVDFKCSNGWLQRFQRRYNIDSFCTKRQDTAKEAYSRCTLPDNVKPILDAYILRNIFTCGEFGLFFNLLPDRVGDVKGELCFEGGKSRERVTVLVACNGDGSEKLKPIIVANDENPQCLDGMSHTPLIYKSNEYSWVTKNIFLEWIKDLEWQMSLQNRKILLLMDRSDIHNSCESLTLNQIRILYLPTDDLSYTMLPLDEGIIYQLKSIYRRRLVIYYLGKIKKGIRVCDIAKWNLLDVMRKLAVSWGAIGNEIISQAFLKCGLSSTPGADNIEIKLQPDDFDEWLEIQCFIDGPIMFEDFVNADNALETYCSFFTEASELELVPDLMDVKSESEGIREVLSEIEAPREIPLPTRIEAYLAISVLENIVHRLGDPIVSKSMENIRDSVYKLYKKH